MNPAAWTAAQVAHDNRAPADDCEEFLDDDAALEQARDELQATPETLAAWLLQECTGDDKPLQVHSLGDADDLTVPQLLAVAFGGHDAASRRAMHALREAFEKAHAGEAQARANELLAAQAKRLDQDRSDWLVAA